MSSLEGTPELYAPNYRERRISEVLGHISLFSGDENIFVGFLEERHVLRQALTSLEQELFELNGLPAEASEETVDAVHEKYEEQRKSLLDN